MKKMLLNVMVGLSFLMVGATKGKEVKVAFETDYDNVAIMKSECKEVGDFVVEFTNFNGLKTTTKVNKVDGERIEIPTDCVEVKVVREK